MLVPHDRCRFQGSLVALVTPFRNGAVDWAAFQRLVDGHLEQASDGLVIAGTTGEAATLDDEERRGLFELAVARARRRMPVLAGIGTNSTRTTLAMARLAEEAGVDGLLAVTPYYNRPSQRGLVEHYSALASATSLPVVLYNVPSRTGVDLAVETVGELGRRHANVVAVKEAVPSARKAERIVRETPVALLCGDDASIADFMGAGAVGHVGVVSNVLPAATAELVRAARPSGDPARAAAIVEIVAPLVRDLFVESNPVPVKAVLADEGRCTAEVRLPLVGLEPQNRERVLATWRAVRDAIGAG